MSRTDRDDDCPSTTDALPIDTSGRVVNDHSAVAGDIPVGVYEIWAVYVEPDTNGWRGTMTTWCRLAST